MAKDPTEPVRIPQLLLGLVLLGLGVALLLSRLEIVEVSFWSLIGTWWPLAIVGLGLAALFTVPRAWPGPLLVILLGVILQLARLELFDVPLASLLWPIALIVVGLTLLLRFGRPPRDDADRITSTVLWWGSNPRSRSQSFRSASLTAVMGGIELDLREADVQGRADISIFALWAGVEVKVPPSWRVRVRGLPVLGGWEDKTVDPADPNAPELVVHVTTIMGGAEIKNALPKVPQA
mgnify:CR=1 FL=1|jgi:hypothetical protein